MTVGGVCILGHYHGQELVYDSGGSFECHFILLAMIRLLESLTLSHLKKPWLHFSVQLFLGPQTNLKYRLKDYKLNNVKINSKFLLLPSSELELIM